MINCWDWYCVVVHNCFIYDTWYVYNILMHDVAVILHNHMLRDMSNITCVFFISFVYWCPYLYVCVCACAYMFGCLCVYMYIYACGLCIIICKPAVIYTSSFLYCGLLWYCNNFFPHYIYTPTNNYKYYIMYANVNDHNSHLLRSSLTVVKHSMHSQYLEHPFAITDSMCICIHTTNNYKI